MWWPPGWPSRRRKAAATSFRPALRGRAEGQLTSWDDVAGRPGRAGPEATAGQVGVRGGSPSVWRIATGMPTAGGARKAPGQRSTAGRAERAPGRRVRQECRIESAATRGKPSDTADSKRPSGARRGVLARRTPPGARSPWDPLALPAERAAFGGRRRLRLVTGRGGLGDGDQWLVCGDLGVERIHRPAGRGGPAGERGRGCRGLRGSGEADDRDSDAVRSGHGQGVGGLGEPEGQRDEVVRGAERGDGWLGGATA